MTINMRLILAAALIALTTASTLHTYVPVTRKVIILRNREKTPTPIPNTPYHEQDSYYSYTTLDDAQKQIFAYVDPVESKNLPRIPLAEQTAHSPVRDTPDVQRAKQQHFEAFRAAERRASLVKNDEPNDAGMHNEQRSELQRTREKIVLDMIKQNNLNPTANPTYMEEVNRIREFIDLQKTRDEQPVNEPEPEPEPEQSDDSENVHKEMTTYAINERLAEEVSTDLIEPLNLHTIYNIEDADSKRVLKLGNLDGTFFQAQSISGSQLQDQHAPKNLEEPSSTILETVRVPVNAYYTVLAPNGKYSVVTPTIYKSVPRSESLKRGHSLPISLSTTFLSHRINAKPSKTHSAQFSSKYPC